jgi:exodeoxyribonuclease V alpha subunit
MIDWPSAASLPDLSDHQREQYALAARGSIAVLGGRPGTGKTFSLARILSSIPSGRSAVAAPTGKAAVRITESLQSAGVQGIRATTIHSLLGPSRDEDSGQWSFEHNEENPLDLDWIFVDESSMVDAPLAASLLEARKPGCRIMFVGDVNQLAPVGYGAPLRDMTAAGVPYGELTEIRRNAGRIVRCCHGIIDKHRFEPSPKLDLAAESPENLLHVERRDPDGQVEAIKAMLERFRGGMELQVRKDREIVSRRIDPVWDCQILVPVNEKSPLGRVRLNKTLQGFLNPGGETAAGSPFRVDDKIVCTRNHMAIKERSTKYGA